MRRHTLVVLGGVALLAGGCVPLGCTDIGCSGTLNLIFTAESWAEGSYQVTMDVGGDYLERCRFTIPLSDPNPQAGSSCWTAPTIDGSQLAVAMPTPMDDGLVDVDIVLLLDEAVVVEETLTPEWGEPVYPNGKRCDEGYGCLSGEATIAL